MICPKCKGEFVKEDGNYKCAVCEICLPVVFYGYTLRQEDINKLVLEGISDEIEFYSSTKRKKFKAKLVYDNNKVEFDFQHKGNKKDNKDIGERNKKENTVSIFLNTLSSGVVRVFLIDGDKKDEKVFDFGTKATRYSHALSLIAVLPLIPEDKKLRIISDDIAFVKYTLGEATPRDREIRVGIYVLLDNLKKYTWSLELSMKKVRLKGGNSKLLSNNLFPYIDVKKSTQEGRIVVEIENCNLAVEEHFMEYMQQARRLKLGKYVVPETLEERLNNWLQAATTVRNE